MKKTVLVGFTSDIEVKWVESLKQKKAPVIWFGLSQSTDLSFRGLYSLDCQMDYQLDKKFESIELSGEERHQVTRAVQRTPEGYSCLLSDMDDYISYHINAFSHLLKLQQVASLILSERYESGWIVLFRLVAQKMGVPCYVVFNDELIPYTDSIGALVPNYRSYHDAINPVVKNLYKLKKNRECSERPRRVALGKKALIVDSGASMQLDTLWSEIHQKINQNNSIDTVIDFCHCSGGESSFYLASYLSKTGLSYFYSDALEKDLDGYAGELLASSCTEAVCAYLKAGGSGTTKPSAFSKIETQLMEV